MSRTLWAMLISGGVLFVMYLVILAPARSGYGYSGHSSGFFFFSGGNTRVYHHGRSVRQGSRGGPRVSSRGLSGGK
jgi:hypothetical protein